VAVDDDQLHRFYEDHLPTRFGEDRARVELRLLADAARGRSAPRVLDLGCGDGQLTARAASVVRDGSVIGMDWSAAALERARARGVTTVQGGVDGVDLPFPDGAFAVVMMNEIVEHLVEIDHAVAEARRVMAPGGRLLLSTPNLAAWFNRALLAVGVQPMFSEVSRIGIFGRPGSEVVGHLRLFTRRALDQFLAAHGFVHVTIAGAAYHDVPRPARPLDRAFARWPSAAAILVASAEKP
jgi:SAM-dependent methyltransferase